MVEAIIKRVLDTVRSNRNVDLISVSGDYGARFICAVLAVDGVPIKVAASCAVTINAKRADGQSKAFEGSVNEDGTVKVPITQWMLEIAHTRTECTVSAVGIDTKLSATPFDIEVAETPHQSEEISPDDPDYDVLVQVLAGEASRNAAEAERVKAEEARALAEKERASAETERDQAETEREEAEALRATAETQREQAEASRNAAEAARVKAEEARASAFLAMDGRISRNEKRVATLEAAVYGDLAQEVEDNSVAYVKDVPSNALSAVKISAIGGMTYKDGDTLKSAPVTEVESVGANLIPFPYAETTKTLNGITFTDNGDGSLTINGTATGSSWFYLSQNNIDLTLFEVGQTYSLSGGTDQVEINILFQGVTWGGEKFTITEEMLNAPNINVEIRIKDGTSVSNVTIYPMLNKGPTALPCAPYVRHALPIPEAIQALDGYGEGINANCYNYVDCEKKQFVKCSGKVDMGTLSWNSAADGDKHFKYSYDLQGKIKVNYSSPGMIAENYRAAPWGSTTIGDLSMNDNGVIRVYVEASSATKPSGMLYYELATPEVTDISDILSADNYIEVEGGGTLTFENEYKYGVPSEVTFVTKEVSE